VDGVAPGSPAEAAGFQRGDDLLFLAGQPIVSVADVSWILHHAETNDNLEAVVTRNGQRETLDLRLEDGWRRHSDISRRVGTWPMRAMAFGGMKLEELDESKRRRLGIDPDKLALEAVHVGRYNKHAAARKAGFREGDVIVSVGGNDARLTESQLLTRNIENHRPGETIPTQVLRSGKRIELAMPVQ